MKATPILYNNILHGFEFRNEGAIIFYGTKSTDLDKLKSFFPQKFIKLKQTHSDKIVHTKTLSKDDVVADAHWTEDLQLGLLIQTADCLPVMIYDSSTKKISAIHAGWRGIVNQIIPKTIKAIYTLKSNLHIYIGPCIHDTSFEIDKDVFDQLQTCTQKQNSFGRFDPKKNKYHYDLLKVAKAQIEELGIPFKLEILNENTVTNTSFSSYRREKSPCRNWSFILKSK